MKTSLKLVLVLLGFGLTSNAQNAKEAVQNTKQIVEGKKMLERDIKELGVFKAQLELLNRSFETKNSDEVNQLKANIVADMVREVEQSGEKAKKARREIAQSSAEVRSDRREIRRNREDSERGRYDRDDDRRDMARDRVNKRDDKRDRRDDVRDFEQQIARADRQAEILKTLKSYNFTFDNSEDALAKKQLVLDFAGSMQQDIEATKRELAEDNRERNEDRRERRDDRNERNENDIKKKRRGW
ncbi:hypothetical protein [Winogradskyella sp.]|uniref:hypothetical protein n=1 Tax=Winogradskyella sp. TaxID=1883156 RepID=UPI0026018506|nr:hypothetical protein [Winogradskyella sp.]